MLLILLNHPTRWNGASSSQWDTSPTKDSRSSALEISRLFCNPSCRMDTIRVRRSRLRAILSMRNLYRSHSL